MNINSINDYRQFDPHTDPGKYSYLYQDLPCSLDTLCTLVQNQLVHPWHGGQQPQGRHYQPRNNYHVQDILEQLLDLNQSGLFADRPAQYRSTDDLFYVKLNFGHDFNAILGSGPHYWEAPPLFHIKMEGMADWHLALLDKIAHLLEEPDRNLSILQGLQRKYKVLQGQMSAWSIFAQTVYS